MCRRKGIDGLGNTLAYSRNRVVSGSLDEISRAIGALQADVGEGIRQREVMSEKLDKISEQLGGLTMIKADVEEMKPHVEDWKRTKQRGIGLLTLAGVGGGTIATGLSSILKKIGWSG